MRSFIIHRKHPPIPNVPFFEQFQTRAVLFGYASLDARKLDGRFPQPILVKSADVERNKVLASTCHFQENLAPLRSNHKSHITELDLPQAFLGGRKHCKQILR